MEALIKEIHKLLEGINEGALRSAQIVKGLRSFSGMDSAIHLLDARLGDRIRVNKNYGDISIQTVL